MTMSLINFQIKLIVLFTFWYLLLLKQATMFCAILKLWKRTILIFSKKQWRRKLIDSNMRKYFNWFRFMRSLTINRWFHLHGLLKGSGMLWVSSWNTKHVFVLKVKIRFMVDYWSPRAPVAKSSTIRTMLILHKKWMGLQTFWLNFDTHPSSNRY